MRAFWGPRWAVVLFVLVSCLGASAGPAMASQARGPKAAKQLRAVKSAGQLRGGRPLADALTASGHLNRHAQGSFDARGYHMVLSPTGAPRFVRGSAPVAADAWWSDSFGNVGAGNASTINAVAVWGQNIYIGGSFSTVSYDADQTMNNVAMYNGHGWYPLGSASSNGVNGEVDALAVSGSTVYVGGQFTSASGTPASAIAKWNGSAWSGLGAGMTDPVSGGTPAVDSLLLAGSTLYAGGNFDDAGTAVAHSVAAWNGTTWSALGAGIQDCIYFNTANHCYTGDEGDGTVQALAFNSGTLYAGGSFNQAGGTIMSGLAAWNGSSWSTIGSVINGGGLGAVDALTYANSTLYVGGSFDHVNGALNSTGGVSSAGTPAASVATRSGSAWHTLGTGVQNCSGCGSATVYALAYLGGRLYMSGNFYGAGGDGAANTAVWNGSSWSPIGPNLDGAPSALLSTTSGVVAVGGFSGTADSSVTLNHIGRWNGTAWTGYGLGLSYGTNAGSVGVVAASNHTLYAGGNFYVAGWTPAQNLAMFDGTSWHTVGGGLSGASAAPYAILISGRDVYVGGSFTQAGTTAASNIAMWDGSAWHALGSGLDGTVYALTLYNGKLWAGGNFAHAGSVAASDVAVWDPTTSTWSAVGGNLHYDGDVTALAGVTQSPYNHYMVIGGNFGQVDTGGSSPVYTTVNSALYFDTTQTTTAGYYTLGVSPNVGVTTNTSSGPIAGTVNSILVDGLNAYLGGSFSDGGSVASNGFVLYDLNTGVWSSPGVVGGGSGSGTVSSIVKVGPAYFIGGDFTTAGNVTASDVAEYAPASHTWSALGSGLAVGANSFGSPSASSLAESADGLYIGGGFGISGGKAAENLALWGATAFPLKLSQTASPSTVKLGATATYTGTVRNTAASAAAGVKVVANLPAHSTFVSASPSQGTCTDSGATVTCTLGSMAAGASATVPITVSETGTGSATNVLTASETGSSYTSVARATVTVTS